MKANLLVRYLLASALSLLVLPLVSKAQTTVFQDTFSNGSTLNPTTAVVPTSNSTAYEIASTKNAGSSNTLTGGKLTLAIPSTTSGYTEAQAQFTNSPLTLSSSGQYVEVYATFTDTTNLFNGSAVNQESFTTGLYNSGGVALTDGANLWSSGLNATSSTYESGNAAGWVGNSGQIAYSDSTSVISALFARPAQTGTSNFDQELAYEGGSFVGAPGPVTLGGYGDTNTLPDPVLTVGSTYTVAFQVIFVSSTSDVLVEKLLSGAGLGGTTLLSTAAVSGTDITNMYDSLEIGYRTTGTTGNDPATTMPISDVTVLSGTTSVPTVIPEPCSFALVVLALSGGALFARRKRFRA